MKNIYIAPHIPKTGGVSVRKILGRHFGAGLLLDYRDEVLPMVRPGHANGRQWKTVAPGGIQSEFYIQPEVECIYGHFQATKYDDLLVSGSRKMVWFRDPVQRLLSWFYYWKRSPDPSNFFCVELEQNGFGIEYFLKSDRICDEQFHYIEGTDIDDYYFVGITEEFDRSMALMRKLLGITLEYEPPADNMNPSKSRPAECYDIDDSLLALVRNRNRLDYDVYDTARRRFRELCAAHGV